MTSVMRSLASAAVSGFHSRNRAFSFSAKASTMVSCPRSQCSAIGPRRYRQVLHCGDMETEGDQLTRWSLYHNIFALADGRDARLPTSIGSKILLRRESTAGDTRIHGHRRKVTEPALVIVGAQGNDDSRGGITASANNLYQRLGRGVVYGR